MAGVMIGSYSFGWLSDRAGRKPAFFIAVVVQVAILVRVRSLQLFFPGPGWASFWSDPQLLGLRASQVDICDFSFKIDFSGWSHCRMVVGATTSGVFLVAYVLAMEMVGPKFRF